MPVMCVKCGGVALDYRNINLLENIGPLGSARNCTCSQADEVTQRHHDELFSKMMEKMDVVQKHLSTLSEKIHELEKRISGNQG